jgi:hypothetical protein
MKTTNLGALVLSAVIGCSEPEAPQVPLQTMTIGVDAVRIHEGNPYDTTRTQFADVNYAGQPVMVGNSAEDGFSRALVSLSFPDALFDGRQIENARLYVTVGQTAMSSYDNSVCGLSLPLELHANVSSRWDSDTVTWNTKPSYSAYAFTTADVSVPCGETKEYTFDIPRFELVGHPDIPIMYNGLVILSQDDDTKQFRKEQIARHGGNYQIGRAVQVDAVLSDFKAEVDYR